MPCAYNACQKTSACGRRHIWTLFAEGRACGAREFMKDFYPFLRLILHVLVGSSWDAMQSVGLGAAFSYHAHSILSDGACSGWLAFEYLVNIKNNQESQRLRV